MLRKTKLSLTAAHIFEESQKSNTVMSVEFLQEHACLFCVYSRARWSDFCHGDAIRLDFADDGSIAYADMEVYIHKTMNSAANRFKFLDLVASGIGFTGHNWINTWISALSTLGIDPLVKKPGKCLMPAPGEDDLPCSRPLDCSEVGTWLRLLLGEQAKRHDSARMLSSHSLKATLLSMSAKRGISHQDRLAMGHHAHPFRMADVYAREAQARTIRLLDKLILEVRSGYFKPDETRVGRFDATCQPCHASIDVGAKRFHDDEMARGNIEEDVRSVLEQCVPEPGTQDSDYATSATSDSGEESDEVIPPKPVFAAPEVPSGYQFVQHKKSKTLHLVDLKFPRSTECGRAVNQNYTDKPVVRWDSAVCHLCKRKHKV